MFTSILVLYQLMFKIGSNLYKLHNRRQTNVSSFITTNHRTISPRTISATSKSSSLKNEDIVMGRSELDSHADTIVAGANCCVIYYTGRECDVSPYSSDYKPVKGVPIVSAATAWQSPESGQLYILVLNEALYMPSLPNTLIK